MSFSQRSILLMSTALQATVALVLATPAIAQPAPNARPTGGTVIAGSAAISSTATNTAINQSTQRAAVNWNSFNVGSQQSVTFAQPNASAVTLNRVTGPDPSQIAGRIDANGQVILVNQSGVTFYKGAQVNTNGLMVSAIGASDQSVKNFMASPTGTLALDQPGNPNARVDNRGDITVRQAGLAALVAPQVANSGTITAQLGHVVLAGAKTATLDLYGDGLLSLDVTNQVTQAPAGATALVTNTGVIIADGGTVQLTARAADGIVQTLVQSGGKIRAATMGDQTGTIALNGVGGSIIVSGQLSARGNAPSTSGGNIEVVSDGNVTLASTARVNASGQAGGGVVAIGTNLARAKGGPSVTPTLVAANVSIQNGAKIAADAITNGDGGHVAVLSTASTQMNGLITAKGGTQSGNGGFVEVSGDTLGMAGSVDLSAPNGTLGTLLLDPNFLNVISGVAGSGTEDGNFTTDFGVVVYNDGLTGTPDTISNGVINAFTANVLLQAKNTLTVAANINLTTTAGQNLVMEAGGTLTIDPGIVVTASGNITLATGGAGPSTPPPGLASPLISISGAVNSTGGSVSLLSGAGGTINIGNGGSVGAATITISTGTGGIALTGNAALGQAGSVIDITSTGPVSEAATSTIAANTFGSSGGVTGNVSLLGTGNAITIVTNFPVTGGDLTLVDHNNLTLAGTQSANNLFFEVDNGGGTLTLGATGLSTFPTPATLVAGTGGRISLVADNYAVAAAGSSITTKGGVVELAPFSAIATSILGTTGLIVDSTFLPLIQTNSGTLDVGGFTNVPAGAIHSVSASSVNVGAPLNLTGIATTLRLDSTGAITQPGGPITVSNLTGTGAAWTLNNPANAINTLGNVTALSFDLIDSTSLTINGAATTGTNATITDTGTLTIASGGTLTASTLALTAGNILIAGLLSDGGAGTTNLVANTGTIDDIGTLIAGTLSGSAVGAADLVGGSTTANQVATLGNFSAAGFSLADGISLAVNGAVSGGPTATIADATGSLSIVGSVTAAAVTLVGTSITIPGLVSDGGAGTVLLAAKVGTITETGTLIAGTLSGISPGTTTLTGTNQIAELGTFTASNFSMNDGANLLINGPLIATDIAILAPANQVTLGNGASIVTGGTVRPSGPIQPALEPSNGAPGAYIQAASFTQVGLSTLFGSSGGPATLQISVTGNIQFDPPTGLEAPGSWLILNLTNGTAAGNVFVNALDVSYSAPGGTTLLGTIAGITGGPAAAVGFIEPAINVNYLFNGCIIASAVCSVPAPPTTPVTPVTPVTTPVTPVTPITPVTPPPVAMPLPPVLTTTTETPVVSIANDDQTSALGGLYPFLPGSPPPLISLPNLVLVSLPMLPAPAPQLTDPDVVPPNISYLDY
jgi:filamentous hemagglutinin family protein